MLKKVLFVMSLMALIVFIGCSSKPKSLQAPCTYTNRGGCGPIVPMLQQQVISLYPAPSKSVDISSPLPFLSLRLPNSA
ncbi:MAG: hypothetical protein K0Q74_1060 [Gammaproteobacteria bacterium]|jgi:hypothetical protein|nr:hypothetical protein [Gammaproteobacteria bacterium]